jgi:transcription initiation factor IIE alpha subunit
MLFTLSKAFIIFHTLFLCSECKVALKLYTSERVPDKCPNCGAEFEHGNNEKEIQNKEHSGIDGALV